MKKEHCSICLGSKFVWDQEKEDFIPCTTCNSTGYTEEVTTDLDDEDLEDIQDDKVIPFDEDEHTKYSDD